MQTPQAFVAHVLREAYAQGDVSAASDCASLVEAQGGRVKVVEGDPRLIEGHGRRGPRARRRAAVIVDYHMHLRNERGEARARDVDGRSVRRGGARGRRRRDRLHRARATTSGRLRSLWTVPYQTERCVYDIEPYVEAIVQARERGLPVKLGLEVDYVPEPRGRDARAPGAVSLGLPARLGALHRRARRRRRAAAAGRGRHRGGVAAATSTRSPTRHAAGCSIRCRIPTS